MAIHLNVTPKVYTAFHTPSLGVFLEGVVCKNLIGPANCEEIANSTS